MKNHEVIGWKKDNTGWIQGFYTEDLEGNSSIIYYNSQGVMYNVAVCYDKIFKVLGACDSMGEEIYEGSILQSLVGSQLIKICYGVYSAFCPADEEYMKSIGFYAVSSGYPEMPVGELDKYSVVIGHVIRDPDLYGIEKVEEVNVKKEMEYTFEEAVEKGKTEWWIGKSDRSIVDEQLYVKNLVSICPADLFYDALKNVLGRSLLRKELKFYKSLRKEYEEKSKIIPLEKYIK